MIGVLSLLQRLQQRKPGKLNLPYVFFLLTNQRLGYLLLELQMIGGTVHGDTHFVHLGNYFLHVAALERGMRHLRHDARVLAER